MALEYVNVSTKTYTFDTSVTITNAEIDVPTNANLPRIKCPGGYIPLVPLNANTSASNFQLSYSSSSQQPSYTDAVGSALIDGVRYYGLKHSDYGFYNVWSTNLLPFTMYVTKFVSSSRIITVQTYNVTASDLKSSNYYYFKIPKETNDLILAISVEYPE